MRRLLLGLLLTGCFVSLASAQHAMRVQGANSGCCAQTATAAPGTTDCGLIVRSVGSQTVSGTVTANAGTGTFVVGDGAGDLWGRTRAYEGELIKSALVAHGGNKARAARELGLTRQGLWKKIRRLSQETR